MIKFYCFRIQREDNFTIEDVPEFYREAVLKLLENGGVV